MHQTLHEHKPSFAFVLHDAHVVVACARHASPVRQDIGSIYLDIHDIAKHASVPGTRSPGITQHDCTSGFRSLILPSLQGSTAHQRRADSAARSCQYDRSTQVWYVAYIPANPNARLPWQRMHGRYTQRCMSHQVRLHDARMRMRLTTAKGFGL